MWFHDEAVNTFDELSVPISKEFAVFPNFNRRARVDVFVISTRKNVPVPSLTIALVPLIELGYTHSSTVHEPRVNSVLIELVFIVELLVKDIDVDPNLT